MVFFRACFTSKNCGLVLVGRFNNHGDSSTHNVKPDERTTMQLIISRLVGSFLLLWSAFAHFLRPELSPQLELLKIDWVQQAIARRCCLSSPIWERLLCRVLLSIHKTAMLNCFWRSFDQSLAKFQPWFLFPRLFYFFTTSCVAFFVALITLNWWKKSLDPSPPGWWKKDFPHWIVMLEKNKGEYGAPYHDGYHLYILANNQPKYIG